jgi:lipopolysaccharide cholinephosphotransferase
MQLPEISSHNITTILLMSLIVLIIYLKSTSAENFDSSEFDKFPKLTFMQDMELKKLLKIMHVALTQNKIEYSMCGGTLLGSIRHKNIIPWDDDADVFIFDKDIENIEAIDWSKYGCQIYEHFIGYKICFIDGKNATENGKQVEWNFPFVDIFVISKFGDKYTYKNEKCREFWPNDYLFEEELFPLKLYQFDDMMLYGPNKVYKYLTRYFGIGWETNVEMKTSHIIGNDLKKINFTISDYAKYNNIKPINYLWVFGSSDKHSEDDLVTKFNKDYTIVFVKKADIPIYFGKNNKDKYKQIIKDLDFEVEKSVKPVKIILFNKHGGKFLSF